MKKRIVILDLASLGIGEAPDANRFFSVNADTLGHVSNQSLSVTNLVALGMGNIRWDNPINAIPQIATPIAFYGKMVNQITHTGRSAGFREMFDYTTGLRTVSVMDLMAEQQLNVSIISSFADYMEEQDAIRSVQVPDDRKAFIELSTQMSIQDAGIIYCQLPELNLISERHDVTSYTQHLNWIDIQIGHLMQHLNANDKLVITSSFANDATFDKNITREYLPLIVYNPQNTTGKSLGIKRSSGAVANFIAAYFGLDQPHEIKPNFIKEIN